MGRKQYEREAVLTAAMEVFWRHGYHGCSVQALCEATSLNRKSLYAEFGDKERLFREALDLYVAGAVGQSDLALTREPLGMANIERYFRAMHYDPDCRGCLMTMTVNERALVPEEAVARVAATLDHIKALFVRNLEAAGFDPDDGIRVATFLVFSIQGITTMGKLRGDNTELNRTVDTVLSVLRSNG